MTTMTALECLAIGAEPLEHLPTRRDTAAAEPIPAGNPTTANIGGTDAQILGHLFAKRCTGKIQSLPGNQQRTGTEPTRARGRVDLAVAV